MPVLNIGSISGDWRARRLSNFSPDAFTLDGVKIASAEGFIQGIKFPEKDLTRQQAFNSVGVQAKRLGRKAERRLAWWNGRAVQYGSPEHCQLIEQAIRAKFNQNEGAMRALLATRGMELMHDLGHPESLKTSLPARVFCEILTKIREETIRARSS